MRKAFFPSSSSKNFSIVIYTKSISVLHYKNHAQLNQLYTIRANANGKPDLLVNLRAQFSQRPPRSPLEELVHVLHLHSRMSGRLRLRPGVPLRLGAGGPGTGEGGGGGG